MLVRVPPKYSVWQIIGNLKGKSSLMIFDGHANLKYKYGNGRFWARGYYADAGRKSKDMGRGQLKREGKRPPNRRPLD